MDCSFSSLFCIAGIFVIVAHQQNTTGLRFQVPLVPYLPALSIFFNIELMIHLSPLTWIRFVVWIVIGKPSKTLVGSGFSVFNLLKFSGVLVYFLYGIHHSKESDPTATYSMLMTSSEANKSAWGATTRSASVAAVKGVFSRKAQTSLDKKPIIEEDEIF